MSSIRSWLSLSFLAAVVAVSGCTVPGTDVQIPFIPDLFGPPTTSYQNDVIIIRDMQAIPAEISPGQSTSILVYVQNQAIEEDIDGVTAELYDYCQGLFDLKGDQAQPIGKLLRGETREVSWTLQAKDDIKLLTKCPSDGVKVRIRYAYNTVSSTTIQFIDANEMQRRIETGTFRTTQSYIVLGAGPLKPVMTIEDAQPVPIGSKQTVIGFQMQNKGQGFVQDSKIYKSTIKFESKGYPEIGDQLNICIGRLETDAIKLINGNSPELICKVDIPASVAEKTIEASETIFVTVKGYNYEFRRSAVVTVRPKLQ